MPDALGWIRVEDRLPEDGAEVLVVGKITKHIYLAMYLFSKGTFVVNGQRLHSIEHWQPLPAPPEGK